MFAMPKTCSRATRALLLFSILSGLSSCGGCLGGDGGPLRDAVLGEDVPEKRYKSPVVHVASSKWIGPNGELDIFGVALRREGPLVRWEVAFEATCGEERCEEHDAHYEDEFSDTDEGIIELEHVISPEVTEMEVDVSVYYVATNTENPVQRSGHGLRFTPHNRINDWQTIIEKPEDLENLPISEDGVFDGDLLIVGVHGLEDLSALSALREVHGRLQIQSNPDLVSLRGLEQLERVEGALSVGDNWVLEEHEIPNLREAVRVTFIGINGYGKETLRPVPSLQKADFLDFSGVVGNKTYAGFDALESLETLTIMRSATLEQLIINGNANLTHLEFLAIQENHAIDKLTLGSQLRSIDSLDVRSNFAKPPLQGLSTVEWMQNMTIENNHGLETLEGLSRVRQLEHLNVRNNEDLVSLRGLHNLEIVSSHFEFVGNDNLPHCEVAKLEIRTRGDDARHWSKGLDCP